MQYMFLIYSAEGTGPQPGSDEFQTLMAAYGTFTKEVQDAGKMKEGAPLQGIDTATTIRVRDGKADAVEGPFAETKEVLGEYYILDCENLDEALSYTAKTPTAAYGSIEVRPVMSM